ncbi:UNVERIFIED_CONTAM: hypothetical protein FKN15_069136 [Acipenser sinensis]
MRRKQQQQPLPAGFQICLAEEWCPGCVNFGHTVAICPSQYQEERWSDVPEEREEEPLWWYLACGEGDHPTSRCPGQAWRELSAQKRVKWRSACAWRCRIAVTWGDLLAIAWDRLLTIAWGCCLSCFAWGCCLSCSGGRAPSVFDYLLFEPGERAGLVMCSRGDGVKTPSLELSWECGWSLNKKHLIPESLTWENHNPCSQGTRRSALGKSQPVQSGDSSVCTGKITTRAVRGLVGLHCENHNPCSQGTRRSALGKSQPVQSGDSSVCTGKITTRAVRGLVGLHWENHNPCSLGTRRSALGIPQGVLH